MSTILKTLKKLEEEKSVLEQKLDLKEMVIQDDVQDSLLFGLSNSRRIGLAAAAVLTVALVGTFAVFQNDQSEPRDTKPAQMTQIIPSQPAPVDEPREKPQAHSGIPLALIPEEENTGPGPAVQEPSSGDKVSKAETPPVEETTAPPAQDQDLEPFASLAKVNNMIKNARLSAAQQPAGPSPVAAPRGNVIHIPGLKVKGIIFFAEDNPANYIFISTPTESHMKLKAGENILGATLKKIHPNTASFAYKDQITEMRIGE